MLTIIVAIAADGGIGYQGRMPWHIPGDLRHFRSVTMGHTLIMGQTTFAGMGRPLPGRKTIVVSNDPLFAYPHPDVRVERDLVKVLREYRESDEEVFVAGGRSIFEQALPYVSRLLLTKLPVSYPADTYFPDYPKQDFVLRSKTPIDDFFVEDYRRREKY